MSRLDDLLVKNTTMGLNPEEDLEICKLIASGKENDEKCLLCNNKSIENTKICRPHLIYCWATRK